MHNKWIFWYHNGYLEFAINDTTHVFFPGVQVDPFLTTNAWHHVAVTRSGPTFTFYLDGSSIGTATSDATVPDANAPLTIGKGDGATNIEQHDFMGGRIDEVAIYDRAISAGEIQDLFNNDRDAIVVTTSADVEDPDDGVVSLREAINLANATPGKDSIGFNIPSLPTGLVSLWKAEGDAQDSADGNDGTLQNGTSFGPGIVGQAFSFDGVDDQVVVPHNANQNTGSQITIDAWVDPISSGHGRPIAQKPLPRMWEATHSKPLIRHLDRITAFNSPYGPVAQPTCSRLPPTS